MLIWLFLLFPLSLWCLPSLKVGMELQDPPFEMVDNDGKPSGLSVDLAYALGEFLHQEIDIKDISFMSLIPSLKSNKIDCIISSMSETPERRKSIAFSQPYMQVGICLLISSPSDLQDISEANQKGKVMVVKKGSTGEVWARKHLKKAKIIVLETAPACIQEVVQGKADAFLYDQSVVYQANIDYPKETRVNLRSFVMDDWGIGINKENKELLKQVNEFLIVFKRKKGFEELTDKYLKEEKDAFAKQGIHFYY